MDWYHDPDLTTEQADYLSGLEELRIEQPIIWALLCGIQTSRSIARHIAWPHEDVLLKLRELKREGLVYDTEGRRSILWQFHPNESEHLDYQRWYRAQSKPGGLFNPAERRDEE